VTSASPKITNDLHNVAKPKSVLGESEFTHPFARGSLAVRGHLIERVTDVGLGVLPEMEVVVDHD
jgi:hypothetical protein